MKVVLNLVPKCKRFWSGFSTRWQIPFYLEIVIFELSALTAPCGQVMLLFDHYLT